MNVDTTRMGNVIPLDARRAHRARRRTERLGAANPPAPARLRGAPAVFAFDVASPWTYLAAELVDRRLPWARWRPVAAELIEPRSRGRDPWAGAAERAAALGLPLVWPERPGGPSARRAAAWAAWTGAGRAFALAAGRLAFCGGFDLDDPETLGEAAAAAGLSAQGARSAAADPGWDAELETAARRLLARGATALPALVLDGALVGGEPALAAAVAPVAG